MVNNTKLGKAVVTAKAVWKPTKFIGIFKRSRRFRVMAGRDYIGVYGSLGEAKDNMTNSGYDLEVDRTRREPISNFIAKAHTYLDWVVDTSFEPADLTNALDIRKQLTRGGGAKALIGSQQPCGELIVAPVYGLVPCSSCGGCFAARTGTSSVAV